MSGSIQLNTLKSVPKYTTRYPWECLEVQGRTTIKCSTLELRMISTTPPASNPKNAIKKYLKKCIKTILIELQHHWISLFGYPLVINTTLLLNLARVIKKLEEKEWKKKEREIFVFLCWRGTLGILLMSIHVLKNFIKRVDAKRV